MKASKGDVMRILFLGTPEFAVPSLEALTSSHHQVVAVVTQPDRPKGRKLRMVPPPVKVQAQTKGIVCLQTPSLKAGEIEKKIKAISPNIAVVVAFGQIIPDWLLGLPPQGCLNVHASLLPQYRGAAPIERAIMDGQKETGVSIMKLDSGLDTGPIYKQGKVEITDDDTTGFLYDKLAHLGARLLMQVIAEIEKEKAVLKPQDHSQASYAPKVNKEEGRIDWSLSAEKIHNLVRAFNPAPGAYTFFNSKRLKVWKTKARESYLGKISKQGGEVLVAGKELVVKTSTIPLEILEIQPENKDRMTGAEFVRGYRIKVGDKVGE